MKMNMGRDHTLRTLTDYVVQQKHAALSATAFHDSQRRLIDALGCGLAAFNQAACYKARALALQESAIGRCTLLGTFQRTHPAMAAFANAMAVRFLDGADTYPGGGGHPSDCWAGLVAVAQDRQRNMGQLFQAAQVAYAVFHHVFVCAQLRERGVDNAFYVALGTVAGSAVLMDLDPVQTAHAISLAVVPHVPLAVARTGALSMWKAGASANASRHAVFSAQMAAMGITGPAMPFEGARGLWALTAPCHLASFDRSPNELPPMQRAHMKQFLCDYHSQTPILAAIQLHARLNGEPIQSVHVYTYAFAHDEVGSDPQKWAPRNRETADHSLPWIVAGVLLTGHFGEHLFSDTQLNDAAHQQLTHNIQVHEDPELSFRFPNEVPSRISLTTVSGRHLEVQVDLPVGHPRLPMSDKLLNNKFMALTQPVLGRQASAMLNAMWAMQANDGTASLFEHTVVHHPI